MDVVLGVHFKLGVDIVPLVGRWQIYFDLGGATSDAIFNFWATNLGADEDVRSEHELMVQVICQLIKRIFVPHWAHNGQASLGGLVEEVVHVVGLGVSLLDGSKDDTLHAGALKPWLTHLGSLLGVSTEEWHVDTELVELDEKIIRGHSRVAWNIVSSIDNTGHTHAEQHIYGKLNILKFGVVAASGDSSESLGAEEEGSGEEERSLLATVTAEETLEGGALLEGTIGVVDPSVLEDVAIGGHVGVVHGHADLGVMSLRLVDRGLVHVIPDTVHVVGALEDRGVEEILPVVAGGLVEEVNPDTLAGTALTFVGSLGAGAADEEVGDVLAIDLLALLFEALLVHEVVTGGVDVRVGSNGEATARLPDVVVHLHNVILAEALVVELTVLCVLSIVRVEPEDIDGHAESCEVIIALHDLVSRVILPLGEVVSEGVDGRHGSVTCELRKLLLELLGGGLSTEKVELEGVTLRDEGGVGLLTVVGVVEEAEGLSGVHPGDGGIHGVRVAHDVGDRAIERLGVVAFLFVDVAILVEEAVRLLETSLSEAEVVVALRKTIHVGGVNGEVKTNRVSLNRGFVLLDALLLVLLGSLGAGSVGSGVGGNNLVGDGLVNLSDMVSHTKILGIVVEVVVIIDDDGLVAIDVLDDTEWVELDLVRNLVLSTHKDTVVKDLDKVLEVLLDLDLIPVNADASVADGESLFFIGSLDLDLHDTILEEGHVKVEMAGTEFHSVLLVVLVLVEEKLGLDGVLMDDEAVWLDVIGRHQVVA